MNKYTKIAFVAGLVLVLAVVLAASASAMTEAEIMAEIERLSTLLGGDVSTSGSCDMESFDKDLTVGSKGDDVERLQMFLEDYGVFTLPAGADYGYFGSLTKAAVASYQKENGISPAVGYFGPITREAQAELEMYCDEEPAEEAETRLVFRQVGLNHRLQFHTCVVILRLLVCRLVVLPPPSTVQRLVRV